MVGDDVSIGVVGLGYWGPNLARNFHGLRGVRLAWCCDARPEIRERLSPGPPSHASRASLPDLLDDPDLDAIVLATPVPTHAQPARTVLEAGKHCFVEKPMAQSAAEAETVIEAARDHDRVLMVGHLLQYHPGLRMLKQSVDSGELGEIRYLYSNRLNLGQLRADENALWSLGAHDVSVVLDLAGEEPIELAAHGGSYMHEGIEDVVFAFLRFPSNLTAHLHLSWLDPHKERRFTVVGAKRMATFDDMDLERKATTTTRALTSRRTATANTSRVRERSAARACPTQSPYASSASTSLTASARAAHRSPTVSADFAWSGCSRVSRARWTQRPRGGERGRSS